MGKCCEQGGIQSQFAPVEINAEPEAASFFIAVFLAAPGNRTKNSNFFFLQPVAQGYLATGVESNAH